MQVSGNLASELSLVQRQSHLPVDVGQKHDVGRGSKSLTALPAPVWQQVLCTHVCFL